MSDYTLMIGDSVCIKNIWVRIEWICSTRLCFRSQYGYHLATDISQVEATTYIPNVYR